MPRKELTLKQRVEVIRYQNSHQKEGTRIQAKCFGCGRTQIQSILKAKEVILIDFVKTANKDKKNRIAEFSDIDDAVYKWYCLGRERNIPISGPMLQEEARLIAERLENSQHKASNGWLQSFKARHNLKMLTVCGESASVAQGKVEAWHSRVKDLVIGYEP